MSALLASCVPDHGLHPDYNGASLPDSATVDSAAIAKAAQERTDGPEASEVGASSGAGGSRGAGGSDTRDFGSFPLRSVARAHAGSVAAIQRTDGAMRQNGHAHVLALDGVYVHDAPEGTLAFHPLPAPTRADVTEVAGRTAARVERILGLHGRSLERDGQVEECDRLTAAP